MTASSSGVLNGWRMMSSARKVSKPLPKSEPGTAPKIAEISVATAIAKKATRSRSTPPRVCA